MGLQKDKDTFGTTSATQSAAPAHAWDMAESTTRYTLWITLPVGSHPRASLDGRELRLQLGSASEEGLFHLPADCDPARARATFDGSELEIQIPKTAIRLPPIFRDLEIEPRAPRRAAG